MKKFWFRTAAIFMAVCMLLSVASFAYDGKEYMDLTLNSGDIVEEGQYNASRSEEGLTDFTFDPDYKYINKLVFNAYGSEPIIVKNYAFAGYYVPNNVNEIIFNGSGVIQLGTGVFMQTLITNLDIPSNVIFDDNASSMFEESAVQTANIGCDLCPYMFTECRSLTTVTFTEDNDITEISKSAFASCESLKTITLPSSVKKIDDNAFSDSGISSIELNYGLESIGNCAFESCYNLESVTIPSTVTTIGNSAFMGCDELESITIPASVTTIGTKAVGYDGMSKKIDGFTIYGYSGTAAETYAKKNKITFVALSNVKGVTYTPAWSSVNDYSFSVTDRADKIQVVEANGSTRTFTRNSSNVTIKSYNATGSEVSSLSRELDHEVWTVHTNLTPDSDLKIRAKYENQWINAYYEFSVKTLYSDQSLKSAEIEDSPVKHGKLNCNIVTGSGVSKVRVVYENGATSTYNTSVATLDVENMTYTYNITVNANRSGAIPYQIYIKTSSGWEYATTLYYTVS